MIYREMCGNMVSLLGFGAMRLPQTEDRKIDVAAAREMVAVAMEKGVNYYDTAYPYHGGESEVVMGELLSEYPRDSFFLASKYPGHQIAETYDPAAIFEEQLKKCGVEYFDYYLLHNVNEKSLPVYLDPQWGIIDYFKKQRELGRIKHLGFSTHGATECIRQFLSLYADDMEFCQIQLNYLDWSLQDAKGKYQLLVDMGIPVVVMEPVRGGKLAKLEESQEQRMLAMKPDRSIASWGFRFTQNYEGIKVALSGMSNMEQLLDNLDTFESPVPLNRDELRLILEIAEELKGSVPCTACRYCVDGCPVGLDIPQLISFYNQLLVNPVDMQVGIQASTIPEDKQPSACIGCGACSAICPQNIDIPAIMQDLAEKLKKVPNWEDICRERAEAAKKLRG